MTAQHDVKAILQPHLEKGLELWMEGEALRFKAPKELMNKELMGVLKANKEGIIQWLQSECNDEQQVKSELVDEYPLAYTQSAIWMLYKFAPNSPAYNTTFACTLEDGINEAAVRQAFHALLIRHPVLRSTFADTDAGPKQRVWNHLPMPLQFVDGSQWNEQQLQQQLDNEADAPFDLQKESCLRVKLFRNTVKGDILIATIQHVGADLWALLIVAQDIKAFYEKASKGEALSVDPVGTLYRNHVEWQQQFMESAAGKKERRFWRQQLQSAPINVSLPSNYERPPLLQLKADVVKQIVANDTYQQVKQFCRQNSITPFVFVQTAFQMLVHYFTEQNEFLIGTPTMGRSRKGMDQVVGDFANPVVLRASIDPEATLQALFVQVKDTLLSAMEHQECPFPVVVQDCNPPRDSSRTPLFQLMFVWHQGNADMMPKDGFINQVLPMSGPRGAPYDVMLAVSDLGDHFELNWTYQTSMYNKESVEQFGVITQAFINSVLQSPAQNTVNNVLDKVSEDIPVQQHTYSLKQLDSILLAILDSWQQENKASVTGLEILHQQQSAPTLKSGQLFVLEEANKHPLPILARFTGERVQFAGFLPKHGVIGGKLLNTDLAAMALVPELQTLEYTTLCQWHDAQASRNTIYVAASHEQVAGFYPALSKQFNDIVPLPFLPRNSNGKLDIASLIKLAALDQKRLISGLSSQGFAATDVVVTHQLKNQPTFSEECFSNEPSTFVVKTGSKTSHIDISQRPDAWMVGESLQTDPNAATHLFEALMNTAESFPEKGFLFVDGKGNESLYPYSQLVSDAKVAANGFKQAGISAGEIVMVQMAFDRRFFAAWWGAVLLGVRPLVVATPEQYSDRNGVAQKLYNVAHNFDELVVAADTNRVEQTQNWLGESKRVINADDLLAHNLGEYNAEQYSADPVAFLQLTSGSTGTPKAIQITHRGILHHVASSARFNNYSSDDVSLNWLPFDHVVPILTTHLKDIVLGIQQIQLPTAAVLADPILWLTTMSRYKVNYSWAPNFAFQRVVEAVRSSQTLPPLDLSALKILMNAGEQVLAPVVKAFAAALAPYGLAANVVQPAFGMAEACTCMTYNNDSSKTLSVHFRTTDDPAIVDVVPEAQSSHGFVDLGAVIPGVEVRITNEQNELVKEGVIGRMQIRGPVITPGYLNNPSANEEAFVGDDWFNSGDLGFIWNQRLILTGREKEMIVVNGANYYCFELEKVVADLDGVVPTFVAASGVSTQAGQNSDELVLFYVADDSVALEVLERNIIASVNQAFGVVARYAIPVEKDNFYKTTSGKIQRGQFKKLFESGFYQEQVQAFRERHLEKEVLPDTVFQPQWLSYPARETLEAPTIVDVSRLDQIVDSMPLSQPLVVDLGELVGAHDRVTPAELAAELFNVSEKLSAISSSLVGQDQPILIWLKSSNRYAVTVIKPLIETLCQETGNEQICCVVTSSPDELPCWPKQGTVLWQQDKQQYRLALSATPANALNKEIVLRNGLYLITGGLGGLAEPLCEYLIESKKAKVLLSGRHQLEKNPQRQSQFNRLQARFGSENVFYVCLPNWGVETLHAALQKQLGELSIAQLNGVFHLAGHMELLPLPEISQEHWQQVMDTKVNGSQALAEYLQQYSSKSFLVQYGSLNSYFGGQAAAAYSVANAMQSHITQQLNQAGQIRSWCLNWSVWQGAGMAQQFSQAEIHMACNKGFIPLQVQRDSWMLDQLLQMPPSDYFVGIHSANPAMLRHINWFQRSMQQLDVYVDTSQVPSNVPAFTLQDYLISSQPQVHNPECAVHLCDEPFQRDDDGQVVLSALLAQSANQDEAVDLPQTKLEQQIADIWGQVLGRSVNDISRSFFEYGGHSINATQVVAALNNKLGLPVTVAQLFQYPTIRELAQNAQQQTGNQLSLTLDDCRKRADRFRIDAINPDSQSQIQLVFLPTALGLPNAYGQMVAGLTDFSCYAVSLPATASHSDPLQQAADEIAQLLQQQSLVGGQVVLIGWSMAGVLGYEILQQLSATNQELPRLIMMDSGFADGLHEITFDEDFQRLMFAVELGLTMDKYPDFNQLTDHNKKLQWLQQYLESIGIEVTVEMLVEWWGAYDKRLKNLLTYQASDELVEADITQIVAALHSHGREDLGWKDSNNIVTWKAVQADHQGIVKSQETVDCIRELLL